MGFFAIFVQVVVRADLKFLNVSVVHAGSTHDSTAVDPHELYKNLAATILLQ